MNFFKNNILKIYSKISTITEDILYKNNNNLNSLLNKVGYIKLKLNFNIFENLKIEKKISRNNFFKILIISEDEIHKLLKKIFVENNILDKISSLTGFNYKISYLISYETFSIPDNLKTKEIYANHWHFDKPYSKNTIKLIIPLEKINTNLGAMKILNIDNSKKLKLNNIIKSDFNVIGDEKDLFIFYPNLCAHKAGIPEKNKSRKQLMLQLNPSKEWCYSKYLFNKQFKIEPKFPLKNIFEKIYLF